MTDKKSIVHFCHTADWHLDYFQYNKKERWQDFFKAANECVKRCINEKPDFVIHCGDIFHHFRPSPGAIKLAIDILKKFREADIPFYVIRGNHDASKAQAQRFGGTILKLLDNLGYLKYINDETVNFNDKITITGIGEYGKATGIVLEEVLRNNPLDKNKFNLLALHGYVQGQVSDSIYDMSGYELASTGYNYIALGHYHKNWEDNANNLYCPGSTEQTSINDWDKPDKEGYFKNSGFYSVKVYENNEDYEIKAKRKTFSIRPKGKFELNFPENTPVEEIIKKATSFIEEKDKEEAILRIHFTGILPIGLHGLVNLTKLPATMELKALHVMVTQDFTGKSIKKTKSNITISETIDKILTKTYNFDKKTSDNWEDLVNETVRILGQKTISNEKAEEIKVIYDLIGKTAKKTSTIKIKRKKNKKKNSELKKEKSKDKENKNALKNSQQSQLGSYIKGGKSN